ncbi:acVLRF1 family peptidyl-tRNA hydrolase [Arthrobacter sp. G119Y2]|uniref:acVLRF1 family peptidyl-tRNA hydrolase n=1 Tax=Arthrobacter sp. G119Y2 TaxID=3134965 RepID=UPI0031197D07
MPATRTTYVSPERLPGWLDRFAAGNGELALTPEHGGLHLAAANGTEAEILAPWPDDGRPGRGTNDVERLVSLAGQSRTLGIVLLRRGGYAAGVARDGLLLASKAGTRYVQSRTAAGGGSQQRFARRRSNQADALVQTAAEQAARIFTDQQPEYLVFGGDRALTELLANERIFQPWSGLARLRPLDVQDPKLAVLARAAKDAASVFIRITVP